MKNSEKIEEGIKTAKKLRIAAFALLAVTIVYVIVAWNTPSWMALVIGLMTVAATHWGIKEIKEMKELCEEQERIQEKHK